MRDPRLIAVHRGGLLEPKAHHLLALWAAECAEHVLPLFTEAYPQDHRPLEAIQTARAWASGKATVGQARAASVAAHAAARDASVGSAIFVARATGHAVATAHMADHSLGAAIYATKALEAAGKSTENERTWQQKRLPKEIHELVMSVATEGKFRALGYKEAR